MKNYVLMSLLALGIIGASCSKSDEGVSEGGNAAVSVTLTGGKMQNRAAGEVIQSEENKVVDYGVYVYNSANVLQKFRHYTSLGTQTIDGLTTGSKKVVVLVNLGASSNYPATTEGSNTYSNLQASSISFADVPQTKTEVLASGLPMSGEGTVTLKEGQGDNGSNDVTVQVYRLVAKVKLSGLTVTNPLSGSIGVNIQELGIMRAVKEISVVDASNANEDAYFKGLKDSYTGGTGIYDARLNEVLDNNYDPSSGEIYFYVFPNTGVTNDKATLMTFVSNQPAATEAIRYFPVVINPVAGGGITGTNGTYIQRNTQYALTVTLQHHESGTENPEIIVKPAEINVSVNINDWAVTISQDVIWQ